MRIDAAFPSEYLRAADLQERTTKVVIARVSMAEIGGEHKPILYFKDKQKGIVLNKTNANTIAESYGYETEDWEGREVELFPAWVDFQGRQVQAIRVRIPRKSTARPPSDDGINTPPPIVTSGPREPLNDDIPF